MNLFPRYFLSAVLLFTISNQVVFGQHKPAANSLLKMNQFINSLLKRMTIDEKIGQMTQYTSEMASTGPSIRAGYKSDIQQGLVGSIFNAYTPAYTRQLQQLAVEGTRLKIPLLFGYDVIHGHKTIFPIPLGESSSWDMKVMEKSAQVAAAEASADGLHWTFAPMVDIARDPRWGRVAEGAGEDVWLGSKIARARVSGFQGNDYSAANSVIACVKHYAAYGAAIAGRDYNAVDISQRELWETYLPPFKAAVANTKQAGEAAINAGIDMDMQGGVFHDHLKQSIAEKKVSIATVDAAVRRILEAKYKLGLFTDPYRFCNEERAKTVIMSQANLDAARDAGRKSIVLLKNDNQLLPLKKSGVIALIGPLGNSKRDMIGCWSGAGDWHKSVTLFEGMKAVAGATTKIIYSQGANITENKDLARQLNEQGGELTDLNADSLLVAAIGVAKTADIIVLAVGESQGMTGEATSRTDIGLGQNQRLLMQEMLKLGKPIVMVLMNGRPITLSWEDEHMPAILETWFAGTEAGNSIADVLFGDYNPAGKLTISFPRVMGQIPIYYNAKYTGRPASAGNHYSSKYMDAPNSPLYPFGYGLSYTSFSYSVPIVDKALIKTTDALHISLTVKNTGQFDGEETVQLYIRDLVGSATQRFRKSIS